MTCADCKHYFPLSYQTNMGECRRYPPQLVKSIPEDNRSQVFYPKHTQTWPDHCCGEWAPKPVESSPIFNVLPQQPFRREEHPQ